MVEELCFFCGSAGSDPFCHCYICAEPFHWFCISKKFPRTGERHLVCWRCSCCLICGKAQPDFTCSLCHQPYHAVCFGPNWSLANSHGLVCYRCIKCYSCNSKDVVVSNYPYLCAECSLLQSKGNLCPTCKKCYDDEDFGTEMVECGKCHGWFHKECEKLSDEQYQLLGDLPDYIDFTCTSCSSYFKKSSLSWIHMINDLFYKRLVKFILRYLDQLYFYRDDLLCATTNSYDWVLFGQCYELLLNWWSNNSTRFWKSSETGEWNEFGLDSRMDNVPSVLLSFVKSIVLGGSSDERMRTIDGLLLLEKNCAPNDTNDLLISSNLFKSFPGKDYLYTTLLCKLFNIVISDQSMSLDNIHYTFTSTFLNLIPHLYKDFGLLFAIYKNVMKEVFPWFDIYSSLDGSSVRHDHRYPSWPTDVEEGDLDLNLLLHHLQNYYDPSCVEVESSDNSTYRRNFRSKCDRECLFHHKKGDRDDHNGSRLLYCKEGNWVHVNCYKWFLKGSCTPSVSKDTKSRFHNTFQNNCSFCRLKEAGVFCSFPGCAGKLHFPCAIEKKYSFYADKTVFCSTHRKIKQKAPHGDFEVPQCVLCYDADCEDQVDITLAKHFIAWALKVNCFNKSLEQSGQLSLCPVEYISQRYFWSAMSPGIGIKYTLETKLVNNERDTYLHQGMKEEWSDAKSLSEELYILEVDSAVMAGGAELDMIALDKQGASPNVIKEILLILSLEASLLLSSTVDDVSCESEVMQEHDALMFSPYPSKDSPLLDIIPQIDGTFDEMIEIESSLTSVKCLKCKRVYRTADSCNKHMEQCSFEVDSSDSDDEQNIIVPGQAKGKAIVTSSNTVNHISAPIPSTVYPFIPSHSAASNHQTSAVHARIEKVTPVAVPKVRHSIKEFEYRPKLAPRLAPGTSTFAHGISGVASQLQTVTPGDPTFAHATSSVASNLFSNTFVRNNPSTISIPNVDSVRPSGNCYGTLYQSAAGSYMIVNPNVVCVKTVPQQVVQYVVAEQSTIPSATMVMLSQPTVPSIGQQFIRVAPQPAQITFTNNGSKQHIIGGASQSYLLNSPAIEVREMPNQAQQLITLNQPVIGQQLVNPTSQSLTVNELQEILANQGLASLFGVSVLPSQSSNISATQGYYAPHQSRILASSIPCAQVLNATTNPQGPQISHNSCQSANLFTISDQSHDLILPQQPQILTAPELIVPSRTIQSCDGFAFLTDTQELPIPKSNKLLDQGLPTNQTAAKRKASRPSASCALSSSSPSILKPPISKIVCAPQTTNNATDSGAVGNDHEFSNQGKKIKADTPCHEPSNSGKTSEPGMPMTSSIVDYLNNFTAQDIHSSHEFEINGNTVLSKSLAASSNSNRSIVSKAVPSPMECEGPVEVPEEKLSDSISIFQNVAAPYNTLSDCMLPVVSDLGVKQNPVSTLSMASTSSVSSIKPIVDPSPDSLSSQPSSPDTNNDSGILSAADDNALADVGSESDMRSIASFKCPPPPTFSYRRAAAEQSKGRPDSNAVKSDLKCLSHLTTTERVMNWLKENNNNVAPKVIKVESANGNKSMGKSIIVVKTNKSIPESEKPKDYENLVPNKLKASEETAEDSEQPLPRSSLRPLKLKARINSSIQPSDVSTELMVTPVLDKKETPSEGVAKSDAKPKNIIYEVKSEDGVVFRSQSLNQVWQRVLDAVQDARVAKGLPVYPSTSLNGLQMSGLSQSALQYLLEQLPGNRECRRYVFRFHAPVSPQSAAENPSGCARSEWYNRMSPYDMFSWLASQHRPRPLITTIDYDTELMPSRRPKTELPLAMQYRYLKVTSRTSVGVYRSDIHGRGLFSRQLLEPGEMVIEYTGQVIRAVLADKRERYYQGRGIGCYMFRIDDQTVVDATLNGNAARFINHSCEPNCYSRVVDILGKKHIIIFAQYKILPGEELTYDYKFPIEDDKIPCTCSSKKCRKYMN